MAAYTIPESFGPLDFTFGVRGFSAGRNPPSKAEEAYGLTTIDGTLIMGSSEAQHASDVDGVPWVGSANDSIIFNRTTECKSSLLSVCAALKYWDSPLLVSLDFRRLPQDIFEGWDSESIGEGLYRSWTGYVAFGFDFELTLHLTPGLF